MARPKSQRPSAPGHTHPSPARAAATCDGIQHSPAKPLTRPAGECSRDMAARTDNVFDPSNISHANGIPGSQVGSQWPPTPSHIQPYRAIVIAGQRARWASPGPCLATRQICFGCRRTSRPLRGRPWQSRETLVSSRSAGDAAGRPPQMRLTSQGAQDRNPAAPTSLGRSEPCCGIVDARLLANKEPSEGFPGSAVVWPDSDLLFDSSGRHP